MPSSGSYQVSLKETGQNLCKHWYTLDPETSSGWQILEWCIGIYTKIHAPKTKNLKLIFRVCILGVCGVGGNGWGVGVRRVCEKVNV